MRVSWKWLNELVEIKMSPEELADKITMSGVEVGNIEYLKKEIRGVVVGLIKEIMPHPQADKLCICRVDIGENMLEIVTGATNVEPGQKVPVAVCGALLAGGKRIEETILRGIVSEGMLCSPGEMGIEDNEVLPEQEDGIYILPQEVEVGCDIAVALGWDDIVLELELTPNRADCLGMNNVAREVAALTGGALKLATVAESKEGGECAKLATVDILDTELCSRYVARIVKNIKPAPSPLWLQQRLTASGIRPINNIVDVTNYVMMETGQPLHAFDYDTLKGNRIIVRRAVEGEDLVTLDGQKRVMTAEMLVIADAERAVGLAGVMGGLDTEITDKTVNILLEAAAFKGSNIRRTSHALGLRSEASLRFEKGIEVEQLSSVADRAVELLVELGAGEAVEGNVDCYPVVQERKPIELRLARINGLLGTEIAEGKVEEILSALRITTLNKEDGKWQVIPPSYRRDLVAEVDLIEEVARLYGYDKIPTTLPCGETTQGSKSKEQLVRRDISRIMLSAGMYDIINYSFINPRNFDMMRLSEGHHLRKAVLLKNPLSEEQKAMRTTLLPGLLDTVRKNLHKQNRNLRFSEIGKVYLPGTDSLPEEKWVLGAAVTGKREKTWLESEKGYDFYYLKGILENLFAGLGITGQVYRPVKELSWLHPNRGALVMLNGREVGYIGEVHPEVMDNYSLEQRTIVMEIEIGLLVEEAAKSMRYQPIAKYPAVVRDLALLVPETAEAAEVARIITEAGGELLHSVGLFDLYQGKQVQEGYKSLAFSLTWQAEDKTLTDEEVNVLHDNILLALSKDFGASIRKA